MNGIETQDDQDIKPYFRTLNSIFRVGDSIAGERIQDGMTRLIAVLASQQRYHRATEVAIDMLTTGKKTSSCSEMAAGESNELFVDDEMAAWTSWS